MQVKNSYFLSQPNQPFFVLSIVNAVVAMLLFGLAYKGVIVFHLDIAYDVLFFHVYTLVFLLFTNAFTGFLFTTFPRFNQTQVIEKAYYIKLFFVCVASSILVYVGIFAGNFLFLFGMLLGFIAHSMMLYKLWEIYKKGTVPDKRDSFWILIGIFFGWVAHLLFILFAMGVTPLFSLMINIAIWMYLVFTAFSVAQRMIPFFSHSFAAKNAHFVPVMFILFLLIALSSSFLLSPVLFYLVASLYLAWEIKRWQLHPFASPPILWVLHLALFWLPLGLFLSAIAEIVSILNGVDFYYLSYHLVLLGFLTTVLIGFGTRVILGHSGSVPHADRVSLYLFVATQLVVLFRALYSMDIAFGWEKPFFFDITLALWLVLFGIWGWKFGRVLLFGKRS